MLQLGGAKRHLADGADREDRVDVIDVGVLQISIFCSSLYGEALVWEALHGRRWRFRSVAPARQRSVEAVTDVSHMCPTDAWFAHIDEAAAIYGGELMEQPAC